MNARALTLGFGLFFGLCGTVGAQAPPSPAPSGPPASAPGLPTLPQLPPSMQGVGGQPQPYATFIKDAERQSGLIDVLRKDDEVYLDLDAAQLGTDFIFAPVLAAGVGGNVFGGRIYTPFIVEFERVGKRILWVSKNTAFAAPAGTAYADALGISTADSVIAASPILAQDTAHERIVISAGFFLTDYENLGRDLGGGGGGGGLQLLLGAARPAYTVDPLRSYIEKTKAFPKNDEILANMVFASSRPGDAAGPAAATDGRGVRLLMHWSVIAAPPLGAYVPRLADDRIGYFITAHKDFTNDAAATPFVRYIDRWNFANGPIVYYLTDEIPPEYKPAIRSALLEWNTAFAKAGIPNAIEVRDQPKDADFDPDDVRYSTVRWLTSDQPAFSAYGPHVADPRTGEIFRVEIVIDGEAIRTVKHGYVEQVVPTRESEDGSALVAAGDRAGLIRALLGRVPSAQPAERLCAAPGDCDDFMEQSAEGAALGTLALRAAGATDTQVQRFTDDWLHSVVLHEAGHNFGLRHNFAAAIYPLAKLHDRAFTQRYGLVGSVMHYTPLNLSPPHQPQGDYFQMRLGPYDEWAIRYGYQRFGTVSKPSDEASALQRIANESTRPEYRYATDEDASGPRGVDPHVATFLLSRDPFDFYRNQFDVFDDLVSRLDAVYPRDDRPYYEERLAFLGMMRQYDRAALLAVRYIGGLATSRSHRGQPGGSPPFAPISRADQRAAFATLAQHVFSSQASRLPAALLSDLGPNNYSHRGSEIFNERPDFPVSDEVASLQDDVMFALFSPATLQRIVDQQLRDRDPSRAMSEAELFGWMEAAVWGGAGGRDSGDVLQRALQRRWTNYLIALSLAPSFVLDILGFPGDTAALAHYQLVRLDARLSAALRAPNLDVTTRAHFEDVHDRVNHALNPGTSRGP